MFNFLRRKNAASKPSVDSKMANVSAARTDAKQELLNKIRSDIEKEQAAGRYPMADKVYVSEAVHRLIEADPSFLSEVEPVRDGIRSAGR